MHQLITFVVILTTCTEIGFVVSAVANVTCSSDEQCQTSSVQENGTVYCCGECGNSYCCFDVTLKLDENDCVTESEDVGLENSAKMLGVIIGGMIVSFCGAMVIHALIRKYIKKLQKRRNRDGENGMPMDQQFRPTTTGGGGANSNELELPSYEDIHLYKKVDHDVERGESVVERNGIAKMNRNNVVESDCNTSMEPPPYTVSSQNQVYSSHKSEDSIQPSSNETENTHVGGASSSSTEVAYPSTSGNNSGIATTNRDPKTSQGRDNVLVMVIDLLKTLESGENAGSKQDIINSAKNYLCEVVQAKTDNTSQASEPVPNNTHCGHDSE